MTTFKQDISKYIKGLAEYSHDIFWIKNIDFTKQIYISPAYEKIWGRRCESMYKDPKSWTDYIFSEDLERLHETIEKCRQNITPETKYTEIYRIKRPDGKVFWIKEQGFSIYDNFNKLIGFGGIGQDITDLKKNETARAKVQTLSEARDTYEEYLRSIIDSIAGNHWWKDQNGVYRGYNHTLLKDLGYQSSSDIIGKTDYELPWSEHADRLAAHDREVMRRGVAIEREEVIISPTGERRVYLVNKAPLRNPAGEIIGTIGHGFDITAMKKAQQELQQAKTELEKEKGSIENQLNTVIEAIVGNHWMKDLDGRYLACNNSFARQFGFLSSQELIGKTAHEILSAKEADSIVASDKKAIQKGKAITREEYRIAGDGKVHYFVVTKAPLRNSKGEIVGLVGNATDITDQKNVEIALRQQKEAIAIKSKKQADMLASISVELSAILPSMLHASKTISSKVLDPLFENCIDEFRKGADHLKVLLKKILTLQQQFSKKNNSVQVAIFEKCHVLVIENNPLDQNKIQLLLEALGCTADFVFNSKELVQQIKSNAYDLIFMDTASSSFDAIIKLKSTPIVAITADATEEELERCCQLGIRSILMKPIASNDLKRVLAEHCSDKLQQPAEIDT